MLEKKILFLEDEATIGEITREYMVMQDYDVTWVKDGKIAATLVEKQQFDLAILDIQVPHINGIEILKLIRQHQPEMPVIMLSALGDEQTQLHAFNLFTDDYIIKPFSPLLLLKRIAALLRRTGRTLTPKRTGFYLDEQTFQAYEDNVSLELTMTEFSLLQVLFENQQQVFSREQLLDILFPNDHYPTDRVIDAHVKNVRKKLPHPYIKTVIGVGYRFTLES